MIGESIERATKAHLDRLIMDGSITVGNQNSKRDIGIYLRSVTFTQFQARLHQGIQL